MNSSTLKKLLGLGAFLLIAYAAPSPADSIVIDGTTYTDVYIVATDASYYVQTPKDGKVLSVARSAVAPGDVQISESAAERAELLARWKSNSPRHQMQARTAANRAAQSASAASSELEQSPATPTLRLRGASATPSLEGDARSNGYVPYIKLKDVPLGTALDALLRPMGLDYRIENGIVFVSSPKILRREAFGPMETRQYQFHGNDTLHKIVLGGVGGTSINQTGGGFGGTGSQRGQGSFGGSGQLGGQGGFGGGGLGAQGGQGGFGGGQGGRGGQGGFGGGGGGVGDVTAIGNISQLFSTIDDRLVGEVPATIGGTGYHFQD